MEYCQREDCASQWEVTLSFAFAGVPLRINLCRSCSREVRDAHERIMAQPNTRTRATH